MLGHAALPLPDGRVAGRTRVVNRAAPPVATPLPATPRHANQPPTAGREAAMAHEAQAYIDGAWVDPIVPTPYDLVSPASGERILRLGLSGAAEVDRAVAAAQRAFPAFAATTVADRLALLRRILAEYEARFEAFAAAMTREMGTPIAFSREAQAPSGTAHLQTMIEVLEAFPFGHAMGGTKIAREPIGVVGLITPWNWPVNQIVCKVAPALAAGCAMVLKPSEMAPISAILWAEAMHAAGTPPGVFNMVPGDGPTVGEAIAAHPGIDMVSFTGSNRAGTRVAALAAPTVKRVAQELGGKSPSIILASADLAAAVARGVAGCFNNNGQSCDAPSRMLVPAARHDEAVEIAADAARGFVVGDPADPATTLGPVVSARQFERIQGLIQAGIDEGARLATGGLGRPAGIDRGYYVRPTIFADVRNDMTIARQEIFGPVLAILPYDDVEQAIALANDTPYGLAAFVQSGAGAGDIAEARRVANRLRAGNVTLNEAGWDLFAPFGGYRQSGNGREYGRWGLEEFLETKAIIGWGA
jgi:aldehyde dehydrogenase (NAD+)